MINAEVYSQQLEKIYTVFYVEVAVEEFFASKDKEWFYQAFKELAEK
jgi:hypothetical protein